MVVKITPDTQLWLCAGVPMGPDYAHHRLFASESERLNYFLSKQIWNGNAYSYQRETGAVIAANAENVKHANYLIYKNGSNYYYNFVTAIEYENDNTCRIAFHQDVLNTWWKALVTKPCFVEREHANNDAVGANLTHEDVDTGEFINYYGNELDRLKNLCMVVGFSWTADRESDNITGTIGDDSVSLDVSEWTHKFAGGGMQCNVYSGVKYVAYTDPTQLNAALETLVNVGLANSITSIFMMPVALLPSGYTFGEPIDNVTVKNWTETIEEYPSLDGYIPKNNKLLTGQFCFLQAYNNNGEMANYFYEYFANPKAISFQMTADFGPAATAKLTPKDYKGSPLNWPESMNLSNWPLCSFSYSAYENYLGQNKDSIAAKIGTTVLTSATNTIAAAIGGAMQGAAGAGLAGAAAGSIIPGAGTAAGAAVGTTIGGITGAVSALSGAAMSAASAVAAHVDRMREPNQVSGNTQSGGINAANDMNIFIVYNRGITKEFAKRIDDYFSLYGYKTNELKMPNFTGRKSWNYVKVSGANCYGNMPSEACEKIKQILENGCTFWHTNDVMNYTLDNSIV